MPAPTVAHPTTDPMSWSAVPSVVDASPAVTPSTYRHWKREFGLWLESYPDATTSQLLAEIISVLPQSSKLAGLAYMEKTCTAVETRTIQALMTFLDARYGETDSARSWSRLNQFTEFARAPNEKSKGFPGTVHANNH